MPPKQKKETVAETKKRKAQEAADEADKLDKTNKASTFVTTIARQSSEAAIALLTKYRSLPRYDEEKSKMIEMWGKDKSLKWVNNYLETKACIVTDTQDVHHGYGTKCLTVL